MQLLIDLKDTYDSQLLLLILSILLHLILLKPTKSTARYCYFIVKLKIFLLTVYGEL